MNFFQRYKKILAVILFLGVSVLIGVLIWNMFFKKDSPEVIIETGGQQNSGGLPSIATGTQNIIDTDSGNQNLPFTPGNNQGAVVSDTANGGVTKVQKLTEDKTDNVNLSSDGKVQYYNPRDGKFYRIDENGNKVAMSDKVFYSVQDVTWAPSSDKAILEYPDGSKILYNFTTKKQVSMPSHWEDFSFSPDSNKLVSKSMSLDPANNWLIVSNDDGSQATAIEKIGTNSNIVYPDWSPNQQVVGIYTNGVDFNRQEVFFIGQNEENFKSTIIEGRGLEFQWSEEGSTMLYSVWNTGDNLNPRLWVVDASVDSIGNNRTSLDLATWASKCNYATDTEIYCAVPESLPQGAGLFPDLANDTKDLLYKIDLKNGSKQLIAIPDGAYNVSEIMIPADQKNLFFTDKTTGELYKVEL